MKTFLKTLIASALISNASAYEPFIDFIFGKTYSENFNGSFNNLGSQSENGTLHLKSGESFEIELGIRDDSGLSVGFQSAYKKMAIDDVSISGDSLDSNLISLGLWNSDEVFNLDGNFFTMPIMAFVGKEISLSDKLSLNLGLYFPNMSIIFLKEESKILFWSHYDCCVSTSQT